MKQLQMTALVLAFAGAAAWAADATAGKAAYNRACKSCHGADGTPNATAAKTLKVEMVHLGDAKVQALSDAEVKKMITQGVGKMKPVANLKGAQVDDVIAYMRTLKR
jgi:mono/diheme cytochrome c family protein